MAVDIVAIIKHDLSLQEIVELPSTINTWMDIFQFHKDFNEDRSENIDAVWNEGFQEVTAELIEKEWMARETNQITQLSFILYSAFAYFKINRQTINICPMGRHKWGNLYEKHTREFVMLLIRKIAEKFGSNRVIYCVDSACSTYILEALSKMGWSFEMIEEYGLNEFGTIPKDLTSAVYNYFLIDDFNIDLNQYNGDKYLFNRSTEEYFLEQKFGEKFIIKRK